VTHDFDGDPSRVRGVAARFSGMVEMPSRLTVRGGAVIDGGVTFDVVGPDGASVLSDGRVSR